MRTVGYIPPEKKPRRNERTKSEETEGAEETAPKE